MKWRTESEGRFYDPGETTVIYYDTRSGDTHLLTAFAAHVLREIQAESLSLASLISRIASVVEAGQDTDLQEALEGVLSELVAMDILKQE
ncbi:HPr-rel-A system PqqD family peptide chaperone [Candidatus Marimicrobium litorale]|uniref:HPr-rel-A system PqqD family peptide chaperone n=1 Tax=Candidatus Marimicrobium litorale TaxID=2518991 RepID=A0ABT3T0W2_9GAMM|nr:HPr-rel-A system PqqD family peptide chaperone [Candidatus Marimicrobium litorale]MCX2975897.1 HPr-rel-A system PqqD family peptide chaperone [Candidatus Marimicrobium litorale]